MNLKLVLPEIKHKNSYNNLINEWGKVEKIPTSPTRFFSGDSFEEFLENINSDIVDSKLGVNAHLFLLVDEKDNILGAIQIRHHINHPNLIEDGGHIGYGIAPQYRKKGYATKMLELGIKEAKKLGLDKVLLTCNIDNIGSKKVIEKNGGIFERLDKSGSKYRYWIKV